MTVLAEVVVNTSFTAPFVSTNNTLGLNSFPDLRFLKDGILTAITPTYSEIGSGLYTATFTPLSTGLYTFFIQSQVQGVFRVVSKSLYSFLLNLEDTAIGSWSWNKTTGTLTFTRQDGSPMAGFNVTDNLTTASRARTSP